VSNQVYITLVFGVKGIYTERQNWHYSELVPRFCYIGMSDFYLLKKHCK